MPNMPPTLVPKNLVRSLEANVPLKAARDIRNRALYGRAAPLSDECIYVDPRQVHQSYIARPDRGAPKFRRRHSGLVLGGDWDLSVRTFGGGVKETACQAHFNQGVSWNETGIFDHLLADIARKGSADGCHSLEELQERYRHLDELFEELRSTGNFKHQSELDGYFRREHGGIFIHISRDGEPLRAGGGIHRLSMARILGLRRIPAQIGVIHKDALERGILEQYRSPD